MTADRSLSPQKSFACESCDLGRRAEGNPRSLMARVWRWHTGWCPGWKAYQAYLAEERASATL